MERLGQRDLRSALEFLRESYASPDLEAFQNCVLSALPGLVRAEITAYNDVKAQFEILSRPSLETLPDGPRILEWFVVHYPFLPAKHPLIGYYHRTGDGGAVRISDFLAQRQFRRTELFNEVFRPVRMEYQAAIELYSPPSTTIGIVVMRSRRDFSERERFILNLVRPHLVQAYRNARAMGQMRQQLAAASQLMERLPIGVVVLGRDRRLQTATPRATELFASYFGTAGRSADRLPAELAPWVRQEERTAGAIDGLYPPRRPFVVKRDGRQLTVRALIDAGQTLLLVEEHVTDLHPAMLACLGLTRREAEVLVGIIHERTNREIAASLGVSPRTVGSHLDHIYQKFGVATRAEAARYALDAAVSRRSGGLAAQPSYVHPDEG